MIRKWLMDRKYRLPRIWSNRELRKFAHLFTGRVLNVSGWKDEDKEGGRYSEYFFNSESYHISNFKTEFRGLQGYDNEFFLDLTSVLEQRYMGAFDAVFNHTTLEHIYDIRTAFTNLCLLSSDIVITVVPFVQQMHSTYGDYWRFTPLTVRNLFQESGLSLLYLNFNNTRNTSVYIFAIGSRHPEKWKDLIGNEFTYCCEKDYLDGFENFIGCRAINNSCLFRLIRKF